MNLYVKIPSNSSIEEWAIIELQGDLESRNGSNIHLQFIGDLHYTTNGKPILIIGHHILHGVELKMDKPFAVMERKGKGEVEDSVTSAEYHVKAIVRKKLLFCDRPKPIIANVPKAT